MERLLSHWYSHSSSAKSPFTTKRKSLPPLLISKLVSHHRKTHSAQVKHSWGRRTWLHSCSFLPPLSTHSGVCPAQGRNSACTQAAQGWIGQGRAGQGRTRQRQTKMHLVAPSSCSGLQQCGQHDQHHFIRQAALLCHQVHHLLVGHPFPSYQALKVL